MSILLQNAGLGFQIVLTCDSCGQKITSAASGHWGCKRGIDRPQEPVFVHTGCRELLDQWSGDWFWFAGGLEYFAACFADSVHMDWTRLGGIAAALSAFENQERGN